MRVLIVEDDYLQSDWLKNVLKEFLPEVKTLQIFSELEFRNVLDFLREEPPDLVILDAMLRWTDPAPDMVPAPPEVRLNGFFRAGFRCERLLRQVPETQDVPVILYTVLERGDIQQTEFEPDLQDLHRRTHHVTKDSDPSLLWATIKQVLSESGKVGL